MISLIYEGETLNYRLKFSSKKNLSIVVYPDQTIIVNAPLNTSLEKIKQCVYKKAHWIVQQKNYFSQFQPVPGEKYFLSGESHLYLGKQYRLKVIASSRDKVSLERGVFKVETTDKENKDHIKILMESWYREKAQIHFKKIFEKVCVKFLLPESNQPRMNIRKLQKRWGSLSEKGNLTMNLELIKTPVECIEYVLIHELCHLKVKKHNREFYLHLKSRMPDWEKVKHKLEMALI